MNQIFQRPYTLSIDGKQVGTNAGFDVFNPATNAVLAQAPDATPEHMHAAIASAKRAFPAWSALSWDQRGAYITRFADALAEHRDDLITLLTLEQGKPRHSMATGEVDAAIHWVRETAHRRLPTETIEDTDQHLVQIERTPLGVVGAITPWNFPVLLGLWKIAPALITGNTMVMKPSPYTPLCTLRFGEIAQSVFPPGVLNIVSGGNALGQVLTEHPDVAKISFTGSTATGAKVMASSAATIKRVTLELGGNDPAIVLADADWESLVPTLFWAAFGNSGQWCIASKRIYVHRSIHSEFVAAFVDLGSRQKVGDGMDPDTDLGPIQNRMQYDKLRDLFADTAAHKYATPLGGTIDESLAGNFVPVTIVDNPPADSRIVREEPFGPIVPILAFDSVDEVVRLANDTPFGLGASVWGRDRDAAIAVARRLEAGTVWVDGIHVHGLEVPFGGHKRSGLGVENGVEGLAEYTNSRTMMFHK